jgi:hypothetical protein
VLTMSITHISMHPCVPLLYQSIIMLTLPLSPFQCFFCLFISYLVLPTSYPKDVLPRTLALHHRLPRDRRVSEASHHQGRWCVTAPFCHCILMPPCVLFCVLCFPMCRVPCTVPRSVVHLAFLYPCCCRQCAGASQCRHYIPSLSVSRITLHSASHVRIIMTSASDTLRIPIMNVN